MKRILFTVFTVLLSMLLAAFSFAQGAPGAPTWAPYDCDVSGISCIDLQSLNVIPRIPIMNKSGAFAFSFGLSGGDSYFYPLGGNLYPAAVAYPTIATANSIVGVSYVSGTIANWTLATGGMSCPLSGGSGAYTAYSGWYIQFADGTQHLLPTTDVSYTGTSCSGGFTDQAIDGSGYTLSVTGSTVNSVYSRGGAKLTTTSLTDSNGNSISYSSSKWNDTMGMTTITAGSSGFSWTDVNGGSPAADPTYTAYTLRTVFGCSGETDYNSGDSLLTNVAFPDSTSIGLAYEGTPGHSGDITGRLSQITLRSGSTVGFNYNPSNAGAAPYNFNCTHNLPKSMTRTTSDGKRSYTTAFAVVSGTNYNETDTVVNEGGNKYVYTFSGFTSSGQRAFPTIPVLVEMQYFPNTGTVASPTYSSTATETDTYCYNGATTNCTLSTTAEPIVEMDIYRSIGVSAGSSRTQIQYDGGPSGSCGSGTGNCYGNVTYRASYDFGASTPLRASTTAYGSWTGSTCAPVGNNVVNKPCWTNVTDASGNTLAQTRFTYDAYGNLTKTAVTANGSTYIGQSTANTYNGNGTPSATYDLANNKTTYAYASGSYSDGSPTNLPFATSITKGGLTTYATYDAKGGVKLTDKDANLNVTTYGYQDNCTSGADPWWRIGCITDPLGNVTVKGYDVGAVSSLMEFNSSSSETGNYVTLDGYGRTIDSQRPQSPSGSNYDTVSTYLNFSGVNPTIETTVPCSQSLSTQCGTTYGTINTIDMWGRTVKSAQTGSNATDTITYTENDALSVLGPAPTFDGENTKQVQTEVNGLGWPTKTCRIGNGSSTACGQNSGSANGVTDATTYSFATGSSTVVVQRGGSSGEKHTVVKDGLGRPTSITTPEGGTITNTYDSAGGCTGAGAFPGHLVKKVFANGNNECYLYDTLGRLTDVGGAYSGGGTTQCRRFRFDKTSNGFVTQPSGSTISNVAGRLMEAETDTCGSSPTTITDEWFSYDKDGDMTDMWESTLNSGQYYHSTAAFTGPSLLSVTLASPSIDSATFTLDGEGRQNTMTNKGGTTIVSGTTFNPAGQVTNIAIGSSTDYDGYAYDSNTMNNTGETFQVNSVTETLTPTWNAIGSLKSLAIVDGFNAGGTQTCNFGKSGTPGYDDWNRLLDDDCGTVWAQTFSHDINDNLTQAGSASFNPGYNSSNHETCSTALYDASGNMTEDCLGSIYGWDEYNRMNWVNLSGAGCSTSGECVERDAFGRIVQINSGSAVTEIWYTQAGKTAFMNGSTAAYVYFPAPGGATLIDKPSTYSYFLHKDWLGNARIASTITRACFINRFGLMPDTYE